LAQEKIIKKREKYGVESSGNIGSRRLGGKGVVKEGENVNERKKERKKEKT
jgi:hypothetical protein